MKKTALIIAIILIICGVVALLFYNKKQISEKTKKNVVQTSFPVTVSTVSKQKVDDAISMVGIICGNSEVNLLSETQGRVIAVKADVGHNLSQGQVIALVDDELKKAQLVNAEAGYEKAKKDLERNEQLFKEKSISDAQMDAIRYAYKIAESQYTIAKRQFEDTRIKSPMSGVVTSRLIEVGTVLNNGTPVCNIVDIANLKVKVNVAEKDAFKLKPGDNVDITTDVYPNVALKGKIKNISSRGDESHTYPIEISLQNSRANPLKAGMFARVTFNSISRDEAVVIPREALVGSTRNPQVYIVENNAARIKNIVVANELGNLIEVTQGLNPGENVVVSGQLNLHDNAQVNIVK